MWQAPWAPSAGACPAAGEPAPAAGVARPGRGARRGGGLWQGAATHGKSGHRLGDELSAPSTAARRAAPGAATGAQARTWEGRRGRSVG
eukprot:7035706-Lingulodinium_polyedra.AAC.1